MRVAWVAGRFWLGVQTRQGGGSDSRALLLRGRSVVRPTKPLCEAGFSGARKTEITSPFFQGSTALFASQQGGFCTMRQFHAKAR